MQPSPQAPQAYAPLGNISSDTECSAYGTHCFGGLGRAIDALARPIGFHPVPTEFQWKFRDCLPLVTARATWPFGLTAHLAASTNRRAFEMPSTARTQHAACHQREKDPLVPALPR